MIVLRLETDDGEGIYYSGMWGVVIGDNGNKASEVHPMAYDDAALVGNIREFMMRNDLGVLVKPNFFDLYNITSQTDNNLLRFGFCDSSQYNRWVFNPQWRKQLAMAGIQLCFYEVDERHVLVGDSQVVFLKDYATLVSTVSPTYFDEETIYA